MQSVKKVEFMRAPAKDEGTAPVPIDADTIRQHIAAAVRRDFEEKLAVALQGNAASLLAMNQIEVRASCTLE